MDNGSNQTEEGKREHRYHLNFRSWFARALVILFCDVLSTFFAFFMALYIRYDFKFNFLSLFPEIISKDDNENVNNMNGKYLFFFFFVILNHALFRFMKTLQNAV